jgi:glycosyltransferase involved in cell wall biosynthesis
MKLSIIVPVYNMAADGKLNYCLDSLVNQTIDDYEIIVVNDASTDNSLEILNDYKTRYPDLFVVIDGKVNKHQGGARNEGIKVSKGEWIGFIDADDWIAPEYYEKLIRKGEETGADVVGCKYNLVHSHTFEIGEVAEGNSPDQCGIFDHEKRKHFLQNGGSMVTKVYLGSLIRDNQLTFPEGIFYEDNCAGPVWSMYYRHFEYVDEPLYYYYQHDTSTVHTITERRCEDRLVAGETMIRELKERGFFDEYKTEIENLFTITYYTNTVFSYMRMKKGRKYGFIKRIKRKMVEEFPDFQNNPYYGKYMDEEQKAYTDLFMKNSYAFYVKYKLLWFYRDLRYKNK